MNHIYAEVDHDSKTDHNPCETYKNSIASDHLLIKNSGLPLPQTKEFSKSLMKTFFVKNNPKEISNIFSTIYLFSKNIPEEIRKSTLINSNFYLQSSPYLHRKLVSEIVTKSDLAYPHHISVFVYNQRLFFYLSIDNWLKNIYFDSATKQKTKIFQIDQHLELISSNRSNFPPKGEDDLRKKFWFEIDQQLYLISETSENKTILAKVNPENWTIHQIKILTCQSKDISGYLPLVKDDELYLLYSKYLNGRFSILKCQMETGQCLLEDDLNIKQSKTNLADFRCLTSPIEVNEKYIILGQPIMSNHSSYTNFIMLKKDFEIISISPSFYFDQMNETDDILQMVKFNNRIYLGTNSSKSRLYKLSVDSVLKSLISIDAFY